MRNRNYREGYLLNQNRVRHSTQKLGSAMRGLLVATLVVIVGLIYAAQASRITTYDYKISEVQKEIDDLAARKEDLAAERARLNSIAEAAKSKLALEDAKRARFVEE